MIICQDLFGNLWTYNIGDDSMIVLFESEKQYFGNRFVQPSEINSNSFYFVSDHESEFNNIYEFDNGTVKILVASSYDKYILRNQNKKNHIYYLENIDGFFVVKSYNTINQNIINISNQNEVVFDYFENEILKLKLYSDYHNPTNLLVSNKNTTYQLLKNDIKVDNNKHTPKVVKNDYGMFNLIFNNELYTKGCVVWLHGGPYEQFSKRYNPFVSDLIANNFKVIILNYPGSLGVGNQYESRELSKSELLEFQCDIVERDLKSILDSKRTEINIIGVSYGSIIGHELIQRKKLKYGKIIDFSGLYSGDLIGTIPSLYIFGQYDYALLNADRRKRLEAITNDHKSKVLIIPNQGHIINHRNLSYKVSKQITNFLR